MCLPGLVVGLKDPPEDRHDVRSPLLIQTVVKAEMEMA